MYQAAIHKNLFKRLLRGLVALCIAMLLAGPSMAAGQLSNYLQKVQPQQIFPGATRFGEVTGDPRSHPSSAAKACWVTRISIPTSQAPSAIPASPSISWWESIRKASYAG